MACNTRHFSSKIKLDSWSYISHIAQGGVPIKIIGLFVTIFHFPTKDVVTLSYRATQYIGGKIDITVMAHAISIFQRHVIYFFWNCMLLTKTFLFEHFVGIQRHHFRWIYLEVPPYLTYQYPFILFSHSVILGFQMPDED